ncbi:MAG: Tad domain-containing protein, partial [Planctomycetales bacterium]
MRRLHKHNRQGAVTVWVAVLMPALLVFVGFAIDVGMLYIEKAHLQATADAAALAAGEELPGSDPDLEAAFTKATLDTVAIEFAEKNMPPTFHGKVMGPGDVEVGTWDRFS